MPEQLFFDVEFPNLDNPYLPHLPRDWDLNDNSECGDGSIRNIANFVIERNVSYFPNGKPEKLAQVRHIKTKKEIELLRSTIWDLVKIERGLEDGETAKLLRHSIFASWAIVLIGAVALILHFTGW